MRSPSDYSTQEEVQREPPTFPPPRVGTAVRPRRYLVVRGSTVLGWSRLEHTFRHTGSAAGRFFAELGFESCRSVFRRYRRAGNDSEKLALYVREREALKLRVLESPGDELQARVDL